LTSGTILKPPSITELFCRFAAVERDVIAVVASDFCHGMPPPSAAARYPGFGAAVEPFAAEEDDGEGAGVQVINDTWALYDQTWRPKADMPKPITSCGGYAWRSRGYWPPF
jgi:hypothetical protein